MKITPRIFWSICLFLGFVGICLLWAFDPVTVGIFPPCLFNAATDLYCPGCGSTRACDSLVAGDIGKAFGYNPLFIGSLPFVVYFISIHAWSGIALNKKRQINDKLSPWLLGFAVLTISYGVIRNIPIESLSWMRP
jgi:hypothetical protein